MKRKYILLISFLSIVYLSTFHLSCSKGNGLLAQTSSTEEKIVKNYNKIEGGEIARKISKQFEKQLANRMVGYSFCFLKDGKPIAKGGIGWSRAPWEKESPSVPMTVDTVHHIASVSKTLTTATLLKVMLDKNISLDTPVYKLLGKDFKEFSPRAKRITIKRILNHTSGFNFTPEILRTPYRDHLAELLKEGPPREPSGDPTDIRRPGSGDPPADETRAVYSNINFWLARAVLEDLTNLEYEDAVRKHILKPAKLDGWALRPQPDPRPLGYSIYTPPKQPGSNRVKADFIKHLAGNSGWFTNACGLAAFGYALNSNKGIPKEVKELMFENLIGVEKSKTKAGDVYFHDGVSLDGGRTGFETGLVIFPNDVVGVAMFNTWGNWVVTRQLKKIYGKVFLNCKDS